MKNLQQQKLTTDKIFAITLLIQNEFPEIYKLLTETPISSNMDDLIDFQDYLNSLVLQLKVSKNAIL